MRNLINTLTKREVLSIAFIIIIIGSAWITFAPVGHVGLGFGLGLVGLLIAFTQVMED